MTAESEVQSGSRVVPWRTDDSSSLARRAAVDRQAGSRPSTSQEEDLAANMYRASKSGKQLEPRFSDPLETEGSNTVIEWEREPILNLVTAVIGAGVLGFPFCFKTCGLGLAILLVLVTLAAAELSMRLLLMSSQLTSKRSYEDLARHSFGRLGQWAVDSCIIAMNVGSVVAYLNILTDTISSVAGTVIPPGAEPSRNIMLGVVTMAGVLPVALFVRSAQLLSAVNSVSMVFLLFFCCIIALLPFAPTVNTGTLVWWRWEGVLVAFPIVSYGFTAHQYLFQIYPASQRPSLRKMTIMVQRGMLLSAAIYMAVGACGYGAFGERTSGDVLRNLGASSGGGGVHGVRLQAERVLKYGFGVSLLGVIPLTVIPLHNTFKPWLALCSPAYGVAAKQAEAAGLGTAGVQLSQLQESLLTTGILGVSWALAVLLPNVEFVFGLAGSTASTLMAFILPAAIFLNVTAGQRGMLGHSVDMLRGTDAWRQRRRMAGTLLLFGCMAGVLCTHALVVSIQEEHEVVQLAQELAREETKVAEAAQTEAKAKQVAEAVETVVRAAKEVESAKEEASGQAEKLAMAAQALNTSGGGRKQRQRQKAEATSELQRAHSEVDRTVQKLENVTAVLGATASRMRNETASKAAAAAAAAADVVSEAEAAAAAAARQEQERQSRFQQLARLAAQQAVAHAEQQQQQKERRGTPQSQPQQQQEQQDSVGEPSVGSTAPPTADPGGKSSSASAGTAAHTEVVRAAEAAVAKLHSAVQGNGPPAAGKGGDDEVAEALEKVASTANDTLAAIKQSKAALEAASAEVNTPGNKHVKAGELGKAITQALNATADAAARLNATAAALQAVGREKTSELITLVTKLAAEDEKEAAKEAKQQAAEEARPEQAAGLGGRKRGGGFAAAGSEAEGWGSAGTAAAAAAATAATAAASGSGNTTAAAAANGTVPGMAKPRQEVREALKQAAAAGAAAAAEAAAAGGSGGNLTAAVNVTQMAQAAIDAASTVVASSKATVEQAIEKKKPKVSVRAIEIAKELHAGSTGGAAASSATSSSNSTAAGTGKLVSVLDVAREKHEEIVGRQQQGGAAPTSSPARRVALAGESNAGAAGGPAKSRAHSAAAPAAAPW
ncbi:hypothetical protein ABPG77_011344 [Micractinium sp. CCAP 211/92]